MEADDSEAGSRAWKSVVQLSSRSVGHDVDRRARLTHMVAGSEFGEKLPLTTGQIQCRHIQNHFARMLESGRSGRS
ncbi:hypothetical protein ABBQ38_013046 [Trebouxia sp. C0009 RCD-2024]